MAKASMGNLVKGLCMIVVGLAAALVIWNVLMAMDIVYISSKRSAMTQLVPILTAIPGLIVFMAWFFNRKALGERTQIFDTKLYSFGGFLVIALALDVVAGIAGMALVGFKYLSAGAVDFAIAMVLQLLCCWLAFAFCPPYPRK